MTQEVMAFDDGPREVLVKIGGSDYVLKEATGDAVVKWRDAQLACSVFTPSGRIKAVHNLSTTEPLLVSLCLFNGNDEPVPVEKVKSWPGRIQKALFEKAKEISDLREVDPGVDQLLKALNLTSSPVKLQDFRDWVNGLPEEYQPLKDLVKPTPEELAKNELEDSEVG